MKASFLTGLALATVGSILVVGSTFACPIKGGLSMTGASDPFDEILGGGAYFSTTTPLSTGIDFGRWYGGTVTTATGDFSRLVVNFTRIINYFQFVTFTPEKPLWSIGGFSFAKTILTYEKSTSGGSHLVDFYGTGVLSSADYGPSPGTFSYTGQGAQNGTSFAPTPIPEPATMLLFGTGLAGLAGVVRRKKKV